MTPDLVHVLQEIATAESADEIELLATQAAAVVAALPPHQQETANEKIQDAIAEWRER